MNSAISRMRGCYFILVMLGGLCAHSAEVFAAEAGWTKKADLPAPRLGIHASAVGDLIYVVGGQNTASPNTTPTGTVEVYDPSADTWTEKAAMPTKRGFFSTAVVNEKLYAIGGSANMTRYDPGLAIVEAYDPATDTWTRKADMPTPRADLTASAVNGKIYAIGGTRHVGVDPLGIVEEYDPATNVWTKKADMPTPRLHLTSAVVEGKIYVFGGSPKWPAPLAVTEVYDPATDTWTKKADMPTAKAGMWAAALNGRIFVCGGLSWDAAALATVEEYDPATNGWTKRVDMPTPRFLLAVEAAAGRIFAIGGATTGFTSLPAMEAFTP